MLTSGNTNIKLSKRSNIPPCPGNNLPESFTPKWRLNPDSTKSPNCPNALKIIVIISNNHVTV